MLSLIIYMLIGTVLMYIFVDSDKLEASLPEWYFEYKEYMKDIPGGPYGRGTFDKTVKVMITAWFVLGWPSVLYLLVSKLIKGKK